MPQPTWKDLRLPSDQMTRLRELRGQPPQRHATVFSGPWAAGKTMAAQVLATELGLRLHRVDLTQVASQYIGETEKNLDRIFDEGDAGRTLLFFDEADALFGKRSEVKDAHDRHAGTEVSYLLQRMEAYEGIAILATNLRQNIDSTGARRLRLIDFPLP